MFIFNGVLAESVQEFITRLYLQVSFEQWSKPTSDILWNPGWFGRDPYDGLWNNPYV